MFSILGNMKKAFLILAILIGGIMMQPNVGDNVKENLAGKGRKFLDLLAFARL